MANRTADRLSAQLARLLSDAAIPGSAAAIPPVPALGPFLPGLFLALLNAPAAAAAPWPFEGVWDCEVAVFTFTDSEYDTGDEPMQIVDIAPEGDTFTLTFDDNYQLSLAMNPDATMTWFSPVSGDSFLCRRQE